MSAWTDRTSIDAATMIVNPAVRATDGGFTIGAVAMVAIGAAVITIRVNAIEGTVHARA